MKGLSIYKRYFVIAHTTILERFQSPGRRSLAMIGLTKPGRFVPYAIFREMVKLDTSVLQIMDNSS